MIYVIGVVAANPPLYQNYPSDPAWAAPLCATGMMQSPIDLDGAMKAEVHAPIQFVVKLRRDLFAKYYNNNRAQRYKISNTKRVSVGKSSFMDRWYL